MTIKKLHTSILALIAASSMLAGCVRTTAPADATATPSATITPEVTAEATPNATVTPEATPSATPEATATPSATPEADAPAEDATAATNEDTATVTNDGDDCGWISDPSMADGGWCSLHPEWYGMPANGSGNSA